MKTKNINECEKIKRVLSERLEAHDKSRKAAQEKLEEICKRTETSINGLEDRVGSELEEKYAAESNRLQSALADLQMDSDGDDVSKATQRAKAELLVMQSYDVFKSTANEDTPEFDVSSLYELITERDVVPEVVETLRPTDVRVSKVGKGTISLQFTCLGPDMLKVLSECGVDDQIKYKCLFAKKGEVAGREFDLKEESDGNFTFKPSSLDSGVSHCVRVKVILGDRESEWSDEVELIEKSAGTGKCGPSAGRQDPENLKEREKVERMLSERIEMHDESRRAAQDRLHEICEGLRAQVAELKSRVNKELEEKSTAEDRRLQTILSELRSANYCDAPKMLQRAKAELLVIQSYDIVQCKMKRNNDDEEARFDFASLFELKTERSIVSLEFIDFEGRKPMNLAPSFTEKGNLSLSFTLFDKDEIKVLKGADLPYLEVEVKMRKKGLEESTSRTLTEEYAPGSNEGVCIRALFTGSTTYCLRMRITCQGVSTQWSDEAEFTPHFKECCVWKECPSYVYENSKYSVDEKNPRVATKINYDGRSLCTIIGNMPLPLKTVTSWSIKILESMDIYGRGFYIGIAPSGINQNENRNFNKCGWYFHCHESTLYSGPPHNYNRKGYGQYVHTGDSVGVVMNTVKGEISFVLNGVNLGVAFEGIPLDKPLVPCVILLYGDSVELDLSEVKETIVDSSIPVPSNITTKSGTTWDSITLTWDAVERASFYQIEVDGSKFWDASTTNTFTKRGLLPETEHSFRVRAVRGSTVSGWSGAVKGRTQKESFEMSGWKECPDYIDERIRYYVDEENPRIATKVGDGSCWCTIIGNTPLSLNTVTSWSIKILKSEYNDGGNIFIGVAPSDINQNEYNYDKCGWYFYCHESTLCSGPPYKCNEKEYGPRKEDGQYIHNRDSVGVMMDTAKGELSFVLDGVNLGVAYEGIPLDKPLVPCVLLCNEGDSVKLDISEVKEYVVDSSIPAPSNITAKSITWNSITLTWNAVKGASFYQIEVDGSNFWDASTTNTFTKTGLLAETEHSFKVRAVRGSSASIWSDVVKGRTQKAPDFKENCVWKECPDYVDGNRRYSVNKKNPRIATLINCDYKLCTIIGNTPLPLNTATSWSIKILKSESNDGRDIYIGVAPFDIDQNEDDNWNGCGWYFDCFHSRLWSGPPHRYGFKIYGPCDRYGQYVHTGDSVSVVMDTAKGELSFVLGGVNLGVAYKGIPLDKPLVPCVILKYKGDSVELNTSEVKENAGGWWSFFSSFFK